MLVQCKVCSTTYSKDVCPKCQTPYGQEAPKKIGLGDIVVHRESGQRFIVTYSYISDFGNRVLGGGPMEYLERDVDLVSAMVCSR